MGPLSTLLKIQDLEIVLKESSIVHNDSESDVEGDTDDIQSQIDELKSQVPERQLKHYERVKKNGLGIAQEIQGRCKACHMSIPVGTITNIQSEKSEPICPNCNIYIFLESFGEDK